jgi:hypothetical protein
VQEQKFIYLYRTANTDREREGDLSLLKLHEKTLSKQKHTCT